jgi:hypothetical protein
MLGQKAGRLEAIKETSLQGNIDDRWDLDPVAKKLPKFTHLFYTDPANPPSFVRYLSCSKSYLTGILHHFSVKIDRILKKEKCKVKIFVRLR